MIPQSLCGFPPLSRVTGAENEKKIVATQSKHCTNILTKRCQQHTNRLHTRIHSSFTDKDNAAKIGRLRQRKKEAHRHIISRTLRVLVSPVSNKKNDKKKKHAYRRGKQVVTGGDDVWFYPIVV